MVRVQVLVFCALFAYVKAGGPSKECPTICTLEYFPICATNGTEKITFGNKCALNSYNCLNKDSFKIIKYGECESKNCPEACVDIYSPVCAFNGEKYKTFPNDCERLVANCNAALTRKYEVISEGECE